MSTLSPRVCFVCNRADEGTVVIRQCSRCKSRTYCSRTCQVADWPTHKIACRSGPKWYDKHRKCDDDSLHEGRLELITWSSEDSDSELDGNSNGFLRRWTCCGTDAGMKYGCDHHGSGSKPCTCDFCRMGKPLPIDVYQKKTASRQGLNLLRGPDPRSFNAGLAAMAATSRTMMGLPM